MPKAQEAKYKEVVPGVLIHPDVRFNAAAAQHYFQPLVGKTIESVQLNPDEESNDPQIVLCFSDGSSAFILMDGEGNGPGFIEYQAP